MTKDNNLGTDNGRAGRGFDVPLERLPTKKARGEPLACDDACTIMRGVVTIRAGADATLLSSFFLSPAGKSQQPPWESVSYT